MTAQEGVKYEASGTSLGTGGWAGAGDGSIPPDMGLQAGYTNPPRKRMWRRKGWGGSLLGGIRQRGRDEAASQDVLLEGRWEGPSPRQGTALETELTD